MKLTLDRLDLQSQFVGIACRLTSFEHFKPEAQAAILAVGRATFMEFDGSNYNAIYPPKPAPKAISGDNNIFVSGENNTVIRK